jgi:hypothetical protein
MSANAKNRFQPRFETLESRDGPSLFTLASSALDPWVANLLQPVHTANPAPQLYAVSQFQTAAPHLSYWLGYSSLGDEVVNYAEAHLGRGASLANSPNLTNGKGLQCTDLAEAALTYAGA